MTANEADVQLISFVETLPLLYDKKNKNFKNKRAKENAWCVISKTLKMSEDDCEKRWNVIRNRYSKERSKIIPSGSGANTAMEWILFKYLQFLDPYLQKRKTFDNVKDKSNEGDDGSDEFVLDPETSIVGPLTRSEIEIGSKRAAATLVVTPSTSAQTPSTSGVTKGVGSGETKSGRTTSNSDSGVDTKRQKTGTKTQNPYLKEAVDGLGSLAEERSSRSVEETAIKNFLDSLVPDLKCMSLENLRKCKMDIMKVIENYSL